MSEVYAGTTNVDGTGSASSLNADNSTLDLVGNGFNYDDGSYINHTFFTYLYSDSWNKSGYKEAKIDNADSKIDVINFVDVSINNDSDVDTTIDIVNAKRGDITTGDANDSIDISVYTNYSLWNNTFDIDTGAGNDTVTLTNAQNSQHTSLDVDLGAGNDTIDISGLTASVGGSRILDGGEGTDTLIFSSQHNVTFENFEVITGENNADVTLNEAILAANDSSEFGLVVDSSELSFDGNTSLSVSDLSTGDSAYLASLGLDSSDYSSVTVDYGDTTYHVLTDDSDYTALA